MKKIALIAFLLAVSVAAGRAQESRQDVSISGTGLIEPFIASSTDVQVHSNYALGALVSYRFMLTPSSALEANYGITYQNKIHYLISNTEPLHRGYAHPGGFRRLCAHLQYHKNSIRLLKAGPAGFIFLPIRNSGTTSLDVKQQTQVGAIYGAGIAYEISPSFDIRAEFRGMVIKVPTFGDTQFNDQQVVQHLQSDHRRGLSLLVW